MKIKVRTLAETIGGKIEGDPERECTGFAKIEEAGEGDLTFLANEKYTHFIYTTNASAVLVSNEFVPTAPIAATLVRVDNPYAVLADLMTYVEKMKPQPVGIEQPCFIAQGVEIPKDAYIGAFSYIGEGVVLGSNVKIYSQVYIGNNATIGDNTIVRAGVKIYEDCKIGRCCIIHSGAVIGADGFGFAPKGDSYGKIPQTGIVEIGDNVEIGANTTIDRATFGSTKIGDGTKLDNLIQIGHNVEIGRDNVFSAQTGVSGSVKIGDNNMFGGQVGFAGHIKIGNHNQIGAQSGIHSNIGDGCRMMGTPAIDARKYARMQVYLKDLQTLFSQQKNNHNATTNDQ